ncbi:MAG: Modification methylase MboII [Betaproteobacteria bacterium ADurb.Bin341]|nr:MAG: Modification methylase MboII [Betaproteobacteria bacterium ADurb.Bin341]
MRQMIADGYSGKVQCIVTSPPYWGLRDYGVAGQLGQEPTLCEFIANLVEVFALARDLLADDGTLWMNIGDSYASRGGPTGPQTGAQFINRARGKAAICLANRNAGRDEGLKPKDLVGQPWRLAFALQDAGWYLRQDIVWHKPNPMPESVRDRCTKAHEYLFLLTKNERYYFDQNAIKVPSKNPEDDIRRISQQKSGNKSVPTDTVNGLRPKKVRSPAGWKTGSGSHGSIHEAGREQEIKYAEIDGAMSNRRSVWTIPTESYSEAHFATFPQALVEPCILAGSRPGDIVFDPFLGSGTVAQVAQRLGRHWLGCELNPAYLDLQRDRTRQLGLVLEAA